MSAGAEVSLVMTAADAAFRVIDNALDVLDSPGESTYLGDHGLHTHVTWNINSEALGFDPRQCLWRSTFVLRDDGTTGYRASAPFTLRFTISVEGPPDADVDEDRHVDSGDWGVFKACLTGPTVGEPGPDGCESVCLGNFDLDADDDVDLRDVAGFQSLFTGP